MKEYQEEIPVGRRNFISGQKDRGNTVDLTVANN